jgi:hypothetical protein
VLVGFGWRARSCWTILWRNAELEERLHWSLNRDRRGPTTEDHIAEETANGIAGPQNQ